MNHCKLQNGRALIMASALIPLSGVMKSCLNAGQINERPNFLIIVTDDQSWRDAGIYGSSFIKTPVFDSLALSGIRFNNAFVSAPSSGPSRAAILTGKNFYELGYASMNHTRWHEGEKSYVDYLEEVGYHTGSTGKGWAPGNFRNSGRSHNPAGRVFNEIRLKPPAEGISNIDYASNLADFLQKNEAGSPFCFWAGISEPHRVFEEGSWRRSGKGLSGVELPGFYPDNDSIRGDLLDYAVEIEWFDQQLGLMINILRERGTLENTIIIITSDNGMPFPRAKATSYDSGTRVPLVIYWNKMPVTGRYSDDMVSLIDLAPTIYELAGITPDGGFSGRSLLPILKSRKNGVTDPGREFVITGVERHLPGSRSESLCYPIRSIRTSQYLLILNLEPDRLPAGDPSGDFYPQDDITEGYGDTDGSPTKAAIWLGRENNPYYFDLAFGKRPPVELYDITADPWQLNNLAGESGYAAVVKDLSEKLDRELKATSDPRAVGRGELFEKYAREYPHIKAN